MQKSDAKIKYKTRVQNSDAKLRHKIQTKKSGAKFSWHNAGPTKIKVLSRCSC
jgi:hypothetical protein